MKHQSLGSQVDLNESHRNKSRCASKEVRFEEMDEAPDNVLTNQTLQSINSIQEHSLKAQVRELENKVMERTN